MTKKLSSKDVARGVFALRELDKAKSYLMGGVEGMFIRVALATLLMFMLLTAYTMMGNTGIFLVAGLFLLAMLSPFFVHHAKKLWEGKKTAVERVGVASKRQLQKQDS